MKVYKVTNMANGKCYVGLTTMSIKRRWNSHVSSALKNADNQCLALASAIRKYGKDSFKVEEIDNALNKLELGEKERRWIETLNTMSPNGYNLRTGGEFGYTYSAESAERNRQAHLGKSFMTEEQKRKRSVEMTGSGNHYHGKTHSEEIRAKMREKRKLQVCTEETRAKKREIGKRFAQTAAGKAAVAKRANASREAKSKYYLLQSPEGIVHEGKNVTALAEQYGLQQSRINAVTCGVRHHHKQWTSAVPEHVERFRGKKMKLR